jgi:iron complex outermembrane recepter protein
VATISTVRKDEWQSKYPFQYKYYQSIKLPKFAPRTFLGKIQTTRSFHGFGPSVSWDASALVAGSTNTAEFAFDWGIDAALLFGRQKASVHHQTTAHARPTGNGSRPVYTVYQHAPPTSVRSRSVTVPNVGGFAGLSLKFPNAKVSLGYRADFFFGAMDGGIDAAKRTTTGFYGPFASVSVGIGG